MIGEFDIIARYFTRNSGDPDVVLGIGDDAAVLQIDGLAAVTVDTLVAGVHFPDGMAAQHLGYRLMAVNLSDLAAMGAQPRVGAGLALGGLASAAIDVSDGLLADLGHICEMSGCGAVIDVERVPLSAELLSLFPPQDALAHALGGGDDYELCFTAPPSQAEAIEAALEASGTLVRRLGQLVPGQSVTCRRDGELYVPAAHGYRHF